MAKFKELSNDGKGNRVLECGCKRIFSASPNPVTNMIDDSDMMVMRARCPNCGVIEVFSDEAITSF